uniref:Adenomatous polyposis coli protein n=1 Tax=Schistosoma mansoni TaxID=6183 RepID=A0A5K4FF26_SCHMA
MHPCYNSSSMLSPPTVTTFHSSQSLSSSSQSSYYQSSTHDVSKPNSSEQYNLAHSRHHLYQNVILPSPSIQRFPNSSSNHFTHYSQSHIRTTTSYPSYDCYRNNSTHSQPNISNGLPIMGYPIALNSTKNYVVYEAKNGPTQSIMNNTDETLQYTNPSVIMNIQSQIPYSQYREVSRQPSRRPRPPPPPPPPRSGSWIGKIPVSSPTINDNTTNRPCIQYDYEPPSSCSQIKVNTFSDNPTTTQYTNQQSCISQTFHTSPYSNTYSSLPNGSVGLNSHSNFNIKNQSSTDTNCSIDNSHTDIPIPKRSIQQEHQHRRQQQTYQQYHNQPIRISSSNGDNCQPLTSTTNSTSQSLMNNTNNSSNEQRQQQNCQYLSKQSFINSNSNNNNNSRKEVIKALLNLLIWHHPETNFTETMDPSEIHTFHTFLLNWLTKTENIPVNMNTNMYVAQFSRRILTHLIRILYSDTVYEEETTTDGQTMRETEDEEYTMNALTNEKDGMNNEDNNNNNYLEYPSSFHPNTNEFNQYRLHDTSHFTYCSTKIDYFRFIHVYSYGQNNWTKNDDNTSEKTPCLTNYTNTSINNIENSSLISNSSNFSKINLTDSKILPPNTSLMELKAAAMEAIQKLAPLCQPDSKLYGRDMGIIQLLTSIHSYSLSLSERITQTNSHNNTTHTGDNVTTNNNEAMGNTMMNRKCDNNDNTILNIESSTVCPVAEVAALVRLSFDSMHRNAICELGGVHALISLLRIEQMIWSEYMNSYNNDITNNTNNKTVVLLSSASSSSSSWIHNQNFVTLLENSLALRRYICMALTNLTYAAPENKSFICRRLTNLEALLAQLETGNEELKQVSASVLRNLSWRTDSRSKAALRRVCAAKRLTIAAMSAQRESTLRTTLSALWNLSAHCSQNKRAVCSVDGVFAFLLRMLHLQNPMQNLVIIENSGGILRNISTIIASHDDYRSILHQNNAYPILLELLRNPPSLTVVVNVCGTLWNLTCPSINNVNTIPISSDNNSNTTTNNNISSYNDRLLLLHLGALDLIEQLTQSKHDLIRTSSLAVYRNLIQTDKPVNQNHLIPSVCNSNQVNSQENQLSESSSPITTSMTINSHDQHSVSNEKNPCTNTDGRNSGGDTYYNVNNSAQTSAEQQQPTCKRRVSSRTSRLRFGLLSVVFEAESDDELDDDIDSDDVDETEDDEVEVENEVEGQTNEQNDCINEYNEKVKYEPNNNLCLYYRGGIPISDHSNYRDITVKTSSNRNSESLCDSQLMLSESTNRRHDLSDWYDEINCHGHHQVNHNVNTAVDTGVDDEQTRVYAEEGTPFPSNSANASSLDLNRSDEQFLTNKANNNFNTVNDVHISHNNSNDNDNIHSNAPILIYRNDPIPHVYAVEGTPSNCDSNLSHEDSINNSEVQLNTIGFSRPQKMNFLPHSDIVNEQEDNTYLPSPPEDISNLVTPLTSMNLEVEGDQCVTCHFPMPPPPASFPIVHKESELIDRESELFSSKQTPLIFSRGTSSCMSSLDLEVPFNGYQSSPESEYSSQQKSSNSRERISSELMSINRNHEDNGISSSSSNSSSSKRNCHFRNINHSQNCVGELYETDSCPDEEDVRLPFAEEGTPPPPKDDTENLNALYFHHSHSYKQSDMSSNLNNDCEVNEGVDDDDDDDEDDDNNDNNNHSQILQQCIASAMPSNIPYNVTGHKSSNINFNNSPSTGLLYNEPEDSLKTFAVEDTPFGTSTKTSSLNDLLTTEHKPLEDEEEGECGEGNELMVDSDMNFHSESPFNIKISNHTIKHTSNNLIKQCHTQNVTVSHGDGSSSTSSSLNGDNSSDLLSEVIQSAMPKSGQIRLSNFCSPIDQSSSNDDDCLQMYAVEGTPCVVGNKNLLSSSSSLRHDEISIHSALLPTTTDAMTSNMPLTLASPSSLSTVPYQQSNTTPPIPPLRTTSALTSIADPFTQVSGLTRPRATVAPMLQSKCHSLNSPIVSRSQNISEQSSKSCLNQNENGQQNNDSILLPNSSIPSSSSSPFQYTVGDKDDVSSFSSLLSIESVGMEHSLLQECISSAMPRPKSISMLRKQQHCQQKKQTCQQSTSSISSSSLSSSSSSSSSQQQQPSVSPALKLDTTEHESTNPFANNNIPNNNNVDYCKSNNHEEAINHCHTSLSSSSSLSLSKIHPYRELSVYKVPTTLSCISSNPRGQYSQDGSSSSSSRSRISSSSGNSSNLSLKKFKIPGHNLNNTTVTKLSDNNNNKTAQSFNRGAGTVHFLDHGSDDAQQQEEISYLNMNPVIMNNTITPKHNHASTGASITSTTNTTPVTVNCSSNSNNGSSIITNNQIKQIQMTSKVSCASFGADITNATNHNYSKLSPYYEPRRITSNFNKSSLPLNKTKSGLRAPSSIVSKSFVGMNNNNYSINKQDIDIIDVLDAKDISELLQQGAKTVVSDLMKPCDYINEKQHHSNNKLNNDTTITTTNSNNNNNSQPVSNASSLELLQKLTDLEQSISFDNDDSNTTTNTTTTATTTSNNSNKFNNKMIVTKSVESSNISPPSTCVTNQISSKATSISNIQSVKLHHPHQLSNRKLNNAKFTNHTNNNNNVYGIEKTVVSTIQNQCSSSKLTTMGNNQMLHGNKKTNPNNQNEVQPNLVNHASSSISSGNTVYKYKKNVIQPTTTMNSTHKTTINLDNKNTAQNSTKRTIKQRQQHQRIAMTEPPSVQGHSLASSRSVSAASSISNLKSISRLNNESNIQPPCNSITPKATSIQQISVESVYAALVKQNKSLMNQYSPNRTSNTTVNNNTNKLVSKTSNTGLYAKNTSSHRSFGTISRSNHSTERLTSVEEGIPLTTKLQQSKHNYSRHESNDCMPNALFCGNSTVDLNTKTPDGTLSKATESFGSGTISKNDNNTQASDVPKPIRGGRKSLIGRKTSPSTANMMNMPNNGIPVAVKPISAVKPTQHSLLNNNNNNNKDDNSKISIDKFKKSTTESPVESDINNKDEVKSSKDMNGYTKYEFEQNSRNHDKSIPGTNDCNINDKLENTPPGMWIVREDQDVVVSDFH